MKSCIGKVVSEWKVVNSVLLIGRGAIRMWHLKVCAAVLMGIMIGVTLLPFTGQGSGMLAILQCVVPDSALHKSIGFMDFIYTEFSRNTINEARLYFLKKFCTLYQRVFTNLGNYVASGITTFS